MAAATREIIFIVILILANGVFALSEIAVVVARRARLQQLADGGSARARAALELARAPGQFLSTIQLGITLVGILAGVFSGATVAKALATELKGVPLFAAHSEVLSLACVVGAVTYLTIIIGELVPKRLALQWPERIALAVAGPMRGLSRLALPAVYVINRSTEFVLRLLRVKLVRPPLVTEEEVRLLLDQGTKAGVFEKAERVMVERVFRLADYNVSALMTAREKIVWLDAGATSGEIRRKILESGYSRFPVCRNSLDRVLGTVQVKDLLAGSLASQEIDLKAGLRRPLLVSDRTRVLRLMELFRISATQIALALNAQGAVSGLITVDDILEAVVGNLPSVDEPHSKENYQR